MIIFPDFDGLTAYTQYKLYFFKCNPSARIQVGGLKETLIR